ncbi:MAG TPA: hypothetical protein VE133_06950, partial [Candidatus Sulfotelmatobacter sp.]|nr:hypothetical protein [Candidatus Sulfotelmatobacter sp.]
MDFLNRLPAQARNWESRLRPYINRKIVSLVLVIAGIGLLGYVGNEYWSMYRGQKNLEMEWERQAASVSTPGQPVISPDQMLTRVVIPKIGLDAIVIEGASRKALSAGPGHMKETAM